MVFAGDHLFLNALQFRQARRVLIGSRLAYCIWCDGLHACCQCPTQLPSAAQLLASCCTHLQMMGRAGRRGFDPLGNVVFFGVGPRKIRNLMVGAAVYSSWKARGESLRI